MGCGRERGGLLTLSASSGCSKSIPARKSCADCLGGAGCEVLALSDFRDGGGRERRCVIAIVWVCQLLHDVGMRGRDGGGRRRGVGGDFSRVLCTLAGKRGKGRWKGGTRTCANECLRGHGNKWLCWCGRINGRTFPRKPHKPPPPLLEFASALAPAPLSSSVLSEVAATDPPDCRSEMAFLFWRCFFASTWRVWDLAWYLLQRQYKAYKWRSTSFPVAHRLTWFVCALMAARNCITFSFGRPRK